MDGKIKILFFASNPEAVTPLNLDEEIRSITTKIRASEYRDILDLISRWAVRPDDLLQELNTHKPIVVHFSGHGSKSGELVLMNDLRQPKTVSPSTLKALFSTLKDNIRLVVLNACYSKTQAEAITQVIDCVIGMNKSIGDNAAIAFAASFYRAIGFGRSVKESFDQGKVSLMLESIPEEDTPELLVRTGVDPALVYLVDSKQREETSAISAVASAVGLIDKIADQIDRFMTNSPKPAVPKEHRLKIEKEGDAIVSKSHGQELQRLTAQDLQRLPEATLRHIKVLEQAMENHYSIWAAVYPQLPLASDPIAKAKTEQQLKGIVAGMKNDLDGVLRFLEDSGLHLDDHYMHIRAVVSSA
jgi:hypothetical protein